MFDTQIVSGESAIGRVAAALVGSVGKTMGEAMLAMVQEVYPPDHVEVRFAQWMVDNVGRIGEACAELGIKAPEPGPKLYQRLKIAVIAAFEEEDDDDGITSNQLDGGGHRAG